MEFITSILILGGTLLALYGGTFIIAMLLETILFNRWRYNFSKEGLKNNIEVFLFFSIVGIVILIIASLFSNKK